MNEPINLSASEDRRHQPADEYVQVAATMILAIYRDLNISATGRLLGTTLLDEIGQRAKVRTEDVAAALRHLIDEECLAPHPDGDDWLLELTPQGYQAIHIPKFPKLDLSHPWASLVSRYHQLQAGRRAKTRLSN